MSFTAEVKDELARVEGDCPDCDFAELSAMLRICGSLSLHGNGCFSVRVSTETGAVARTVLAYVHRLLDLETALTVRRSELHRTRNYLIEIREDERLDGVLARLGILTPSRSLAFGAPRALLGKDCCRRAFIRGAFMAGGFIADPRGEFHLEIAVSGEEFAADIIELLAGFGINARLNRRRGSHAIYIKSFADVQELLLLMGAASAARAVEAARRLKSVKNDVNRRVNAEVANGARSASAAADQRELIEELDGRVGLRSLPKALREFCELRLRHPELSLAELGDLAVPPSSKSAMGHRLRRLQEIAAQLPPAE